MNLAAEQGMAALGIGNYYDYEVYGDFAQCARQKNIFPLFGTEIICMDDALRDAGIKINDPGNPGKFYFCGKGITRFDEMTPQATRLIDVIRRNDSTRMAQMVEQMERIFAERGLRTDIDENAVVEMIVRRHGSDRNTVYLQERHVSQAFQEALFAKVRPEERIERLNRILGAETKANAPRRLRHDAERHPLASDEGGQAGVRRRDVCQLRRRAPLDPGTRRRSVLPNAGRRRIADLPSSKQSPDKLIAEIKGRNIHAVEWITIRNKIDVLREYARKMREAGLAITAGTEHNTLDLIPFDPFCKDGAHARRPASALLGRRLRGGGASVSGVARRVRIRGRRWESESELRVGG